MGLSKDMEASKNRLSSAKLPLPVWEFVAMMAALVGLTAMAIDIMLPAIDDISAHYGRERANDQQLILFAYLAGFSLPQLFYGPISDRYGRKLLIRVCLLGYILTAFACMATHSFELLLAARFIQGFFASGLRVTVPTIVRDLTKGRGMARAMSLIMTIFMVIPICAPMIGQGIISISSWPWTFGVLGICGSVLYIWMELRMPETHVRKKRSSLAVGAIVKSYIEVLKHRQTVGYILAGGCSFSALFAFISVSEQIFTESFDFGDAFAFLFSGIALTLVFANLTNARLVEKLGMRRISHTVIFIFIGLAVTNLTLMHVFGEHFWIFYPLFAVNFACFGLLGANFSALAMDPHGERAGVASSAYAFVTSAMSSIIGYAVASRYDGTIGPFLAGFLVLGMAALTIILVTEKGRLFQEKDGA